MFPQVGRNARVAEISRKAFINTTTNGEWSLRVQGFMNDYIKQNKIEQHQTVSHSINRVIYTWRGIPLFGGNKEYKKRIFWNKRR
ncbi:hypothetical protein H9X57_07615 [Flavobacterium piscinae]|uniref:hypothetical protein n=1 Tax=Flavobacterium piscinae TaxID=2506424 RepID=UPI0019911554|nr:hypothetical protein [Flavobacterium piscinae]MBC8883346.1 hypothetical protein [Flavobacterium piscinae]